MIYFFWIDVIIFFMIISILDRFFSSCFGDGENEKIIETIVMDNSGIIVETPREEKVNIGRFGRTNSESSIIIRRKGLIRSKTI